MSVLRTIRTGVWSDSLTYHYCQFIHRFRWAIVTAFVVLSVFAGFEVVQLRSTADNRVFFGPNNPELTALDALEDTYTENNDVLVAVEPKSGNVFDVDTLHAISDLTTALWTAPHATRVDSLTNYQHSYSQQDDIVIRDLVPSNFDYSAAAIAQVRKIAMAEPSLQNLLVSPKGDMAGIRVNFQLPRDDSALIDKVIAHLKQIETDLTAKHPGVALHFTGNVMVMQAFGEAQSRDSMTIVPIMLVVMAGVLYMVMRSWTATAIAFSISCLATFLAMGVANMMGIVISAGSAPAPFIVLIVSLAYSVHLLTQFVDDCRHGASNRVAVISVVESNFFPIFLTGLTTAIGFLSMNASDAPPFHDLGNIAAVGVVVAFILSFTLTPALLEIVPIKAGRDNARTATLLKSLAGLVVRKPLILFCTSITLVVVLGFGVIHMNRSENWIEYFDHSFEFRRDTDVVLEKLSGFDIIEFSVPSGSPGGIEDPAYLHKLDDFTQWLRTQPEVINVVSVSDIIKRIHRNVHSDDAAFDRIPDTRAEAAQYFLLYEMSLPNGLSLADSISVSRTATRITIVARKDGRNLASQDLIPLAERMENWLKTNGGEVMAAKATGLSLMFARLSSRNIELMIGGTSMAVLLVSAILILGLRSFFLGAVSLVADLVPALMAFGLWGYLVAEINVAVSVVAAMTFGIVVDDSIHYMAKYAKARRTLGMTPNQAVDYAFLSVGKAMVFTTIIMCVGFLVLASSSFGVNSTLGLLTAVTFGLALIADLFLLAPLLLICDRGLAVFRWRDIKAIKGAGEHVHLTARVSGYFERMKDGHVVVGSIPGENAVQLWSNDYLALAGHPSIVTAQVAALQGGENDLYMSAVFLNETSLQHRLEQQMAAYVGAEAAVLCQSGWCANMGLIQALTDERTPVYLDQFAHASLWEGTRAAGAPIRAFRHNDIANLELQIQRHGPGLIVVDAVYSSDGTICPLAEITATAERLGCLLVVDESHTVGVYGPHGEGLVHALGLSDRVHYRTFSLSKAFVTRAGMVVGPARVMKYFPYEARPAIFSSAVLPHEVAGLAATLKVIQDEDWRREQLWANTRYLRQGLLKAGFAVHHSDTHVIALHAGTERQTVALRDALEAEGIFGAVFCAPATPKNHAIIRLSTNAGLSESDLNRVIEACAKIKAERKISPWPKHLLVREPKPYVDPAHSDGLEILGSPLQPPVTAAGS